MTSNTSRVAADGEEFNVRNGGQDWVLSWHPATSPAPGGKVHGSAAVCVTADGEVVLVSEDNDSWNFPGGRPEADEDWRGTLEREVREEACASVADAALLGFARNVCVRGMEEGLVLVRAFWRAEVTLQEWDPQHEISERAVMPWDAALNTMTTLRPLLEFAPVFRRIFQEAAVSATQSHDQPPTSLV